MPYFELSKEEITFPPAYFADNQGLVAVGGDMAWERLLLAYNSGIFYWHHPLKHIKWWSPDPRTVLVLDTFELPEKRLKTLEKQFLVTFDTNFEKTLRNCQNSYNKETQLNEQWLSERAFRTFVTLKEKGYAHSVEIWKEDTLAGGLFGVAIGRLFFLEYHFGFHKDADELAVLSLIKKLKLQNFSLIDMEKPTAFFDGLEYDELSRIAYLDMCKQNAELHANRFVPF